MNDCVRHLITLSLASKLNCRAQTRAPDLKVIVVLARNQAPPVIVTIVTLEASTQAGSGHTVQ